MQGDVDGGVFCHFQWIHIVPEEAKFERFQKVGLYQPRPFDRRILAQNGVFTYHPKPNEPLEANPIVDEAKENQFSRDNLDLAVIRVAAKAKPIFQRQLSEIGIDRKTLFPDLDGLSAFVNWSTRRTATYKKAEMT